MPRTAIGTGLVDYILPPQDMPEALRQYVGQPYWKRTLEKAPPADDGAEQLIRMLAAAAEPHKVRLPLLSQDHADPPHAAEDGAAALRSVRRLSRPVARRSRPNSERSIRIC